MLLLPETARTNMPSAEHLVLVASPPPVNAATWRVLKAVAPAALSSSGSWPLSLLANSSLLAMGSTPPLKMSLSMVPAVVPHPLLVGTFGDLVSRRPWLAQLAGLFGLRPVFQRPTLATLLSLLSYELSLSTVSTPVPPPPI